MKTRIVVMTQRQMAKVVEHLVASLEEAERTDGRRRHWRLTFAAPAMVDMEEGSGLPEPAYITTRDITAEGLGFLSHCALIEGQRLLLSIETDDGEVEVAGVVVHCTATVGMFKIGVKFDLIDPVKN